MQQPRRQDRSSDDVDFVSISSEAWSSDLLAALNEMRLEGDMCDMTMKLDDREVISAHKCVLGGISPFFKELVSNVENPEINMEGFLAKNIKLIVDFVYTGRISVRRTDLDSICTVAKALEIKALTKKAGELITKFQDNESPPPTSKNSRKVQVSDNKRAREVSTPGHSNQNASPVRTSKRKRKPNSRFFNNDDVVTGIGDFHKDTIDDALPYVKLSKPQDGHDITVSSIKREIGTVMALPDDSHEETRAEVLEEVKGTEEIEHVEGILGAVSDVKTVSDVIGEDEDNPLHALAPEKELSEFPTSAAHLHTVEPKGNMEDGITEDQLMGAVPVEDMPQPIQVVQKRGEDYMLETVVPVLENYLPVRETDVPDTVRPPSFPAKKPAPKKPSQSRPDSMRRILPGRSVIYGSAALEAPSHEGLTYMCEVCNRCFSNHQYYERHRQKHSQISSQDPLKRFSCDYCDFKTNYNSVLKEHIRRHTGDKPYTCEDCGKSYAQKKTYQMHLDIHRTDPFKCNQCDRTFNYRPNLKKHIRLIHGPESEFRPHVCPICSKCFKRSETLKRHFLTHSSKRSFPCSVCPKAYFNRTALNRHVQNKHEDTGIRYKCKDCGKLYKWKKSIGVHPCRGRPEEGAGNRDGAPFEPVSTQVSVITCDRNKDVTTKELMDDISAAKLKREEFHKALVYESEGETSSESEAWESDGDKHENVENATGTVNG